jgi:thiol:disulfide interchange protein DsbD
MGLPLIAAAGFAGHLLPRAGPWMNRVRAAFGVLLLGVAIWLLQRVVPVPVSMVLWAVLLIVVGVQLGALASASTGWARLWKGVGLIAVLYGSILLVGATAGGQSLLQPLRGVIGGGPATQQTVDFEPVEDAADLRQKLAAAQRAGRPVMLDVYADWCVSCKELEAFTFPDPRVQAALKGAVLLRADVTPNDAGDKALLQRFDLYGPPAVLFFGTDGVERRGYRVVGYKGAAEFAKHTRQAFGRTESPS